MTLADLRGHPFVMDFIFTTCAGPCPVMSAGLSELQDELADTGVRLVSVTVDPETDDVATLAAYAKRFDADPRRWLFLTGDEATIHGIMAALMLAVQRAPDGQAELGFQVAHSTRLVVVDADGVARGYYSGEDPDGRAAAAARARFLDGESHP